MQAWLAAWQHEGEATRRLQLIRKCIKELIKNVKNVSIMEESKNVAPVRVSGCQQNRKQKPNGVGEEERAPSQSYTSYPPANQDEIHHNWAPIHLLQREGKSTGTPSGHTKRAGHGRPDGAVTHVTS